MEARQKILLLDDDSDLLEMYGEILAKLPSHPEIQKAISGPRAMALLDSEPYDLFICDLKMPKMDGLQVLSIVRRKYPHLRTVVLTSVMDEQFRSRVYALGVDLFWQKPGTDQEIKQFLVCLESLLGRESSSGFRGVQNKSLVDIIQLECISQSSSVLRITHGPLTGSIWINAGELVDAEAEGETGEAAFHRILSWKTGSFETLPADPKREKKITRSYNALLLETAQALDESLDAALAGPGGAHANVSPRLALLAKAEGVEFVVVTQRQESSGFESHGIEDADRVAAWARKTLDSFRPFADRLQVGQLEHVECRAPQRHVALAELNDTRFCIGWHNALTPEEVRVRMKKLLALWVS